MAEEEKKKVLLRSRNRSQCKRVPDAGMAEDSADRGPKDTWSKKTLKDFCVDEELCCKEVMNLSSLRGETQSFFSHWILLYM